MAIQEMSLEEFGAVEPYVVPHNMRRFVTDRVRADVRSFLLSGWDCCEVVDVIPRDPTMRDIDRSINAYRKHVRDVDGVELVQKARRMFLVRTEALRQWQATADEGLGEA